MKDHLSQQLEIEAEVLLLCIVLSYKDTSTVLILTVIVPLLIEVLCKSQKSTGL